MMTHKLWTHARGKWREAVSSSICRCLSWLFKLWSDGPFTMEVLAARGVMALLYCSHCHLLYQPDVAWPDYLFSSELVWL